MYSDRLQAMAARRTAERPCERTSEIYSRRRSYNASIKYAVASYLGEDPLFGLICEENDEEGGGGRWMKTRCSFRIRCHDAVLYR